MKSKICKCKREQSSQNEKGGRASTNEDATEMETDYQNLSEMCLSQHHYEQVGYTKWKEIYGTQIILKMFRYFSVNMKNHSPKIILKLFLA